MRLIDADQMAVDESERRLIEVSDEHIKEILSPVPYYPDEIWKFTAMTKRFPTVDAVEVVRCNDCKYCLMKKLLCTQPKNRMFNTGPIVSPYHY